MNGKSSTAGTDEQSAGDGWALPRMFGRWMVLGIVVAILAVGFGATAVLYHQSERESEREEADLVQRSVRVLEASSRALTAALAGASAVIAPDGTVPRLTFNAFAKGTVSNTGVSVLAFVPLVLRADRAAFEARAGLTITERGANGFIAAGERDEYLPVQFVFPETDSSRSVIGFDTGSDPNRLATSNAALVAGELVFSPPIPGQPTGETSVFFAQPLFAPGSVLDTVEQRDVAIVGFASGLTASSAILKSVVDQIPSGSRVGIVDGGTPLAATASPPRTGHSAEFVQGGRMWTITVEYDNADHGATWLMFLATLVLAASVGYFLLRNFRQTHELRLAATNVRELGRLSERLATAGDREQMLATILTHAGHMVGARSVSIAMWSGDGDITLSSLAASGIGVASSVQAPTDMSNPIGTALVTDAPVYIGDGAALRSAYPLIAQRRIDNGAEAVAALPLHRADGDVMGAIEWTWPRARRLRAELRSTLLTTAEVCQQSLYRDEVQQDRWRSASALSELSQRLSVSRTLDQIAQIVVRHASLASGADHVAVGFVNDIGNELRVHHMPFGQLTAADGPSSFTIGVDPGGAMMAMLKRGQPIRFDGTEELRRFPEILDLAGDRLRRAVCMPLIDADGQLRGLIAFVYVTGSDLRLDAEAGRLDTIADLTAQTVERSLLYQHEHELVVNLQRQTLAELPDITGLAIAARYLPASSLLGLGGDWYDVYVLDDGRIGVVVGDVAGHGIDAIADMTEFRTTISTLLRTSTHLGNLPSMSTALLNDDDRSDLRFATAGLMIIDQADGSMRYIRAGHPPAMLRLPSGEVLVLEDGGGAPIGVETHAVDERKLRMPSGSIVLTYTDGLIERRGESIDVGLARLATAFGECDSNDPDVIADTIIAHCHGGRRTDDDTAVLVIVVQ
ncbi:MAG: SpoIIE family protein phosphatase [Ilumatobacteraceae bacterium]